MSSHPCHLLRKNSPFFKPVIPTERKHGSVPARSQLLPYDFRQLFYIDAVSFSSMGEYTLPSNDSF
jgi:hypothetical protein